MTSLREIVIRSGEQNAFLPLRPADRFAAFLRHLNHNDGTCKARQARLIFSKVMKGDGRISGSACFHINPQIFIRHHLTHIVALLACDDRHRFRVLRRYASLFKISDPCFFKIDERGYIIHMAEHIRF